MCRSAHLALLSGFRAVALGMVAGWITILSALPASATPVRPAGSGAQAASGELQVRVAGVVRRDFGSTRYHFATRAYLDSAQTIGTIASQLDFPINAVFAGAEFTLLGGEPGERPWSLGVEALVNVNDPGGVMRDHDWLYWPDRFDGKFSYTESDAALQGYDVTLSGSLGLWRIGPWSVDLLPAFQFYRIDQDLTGIRGWQLDETYHRHDFTIPDTLALTYRITYHVYSMGLRAHRALPGGGSVALDVSPAIASMNDVDDHVLRFKKSTASGNGWALLTGLEARLPLGRTPGPRATALVLRASDEYASIHATQIQRWYGDDPASEEDDTGDVVRGLKHDIILKRASLDLRIEVGF